MDDMQFRDQVSSVLALKLIELQGTSTDAEMGRLLGVSRVHWLHIKAGRRQPSYALIKRATVRWPVLGAIVSHDLTAASTGAAS
jgi:hypothetical protein